MCCFIQYIVLYASFCAPYKTGSTIHLACELLKEARLIKIFAVNGTADYALFDETCFKFPWIL